MHRPEQDCGLSEDLLRLVQPVREVQTGDTDMGEEEGQVWKGNKLGHSDGNSNNTFLFPDRRRCKHQRNPRLQQIFLAYQQTECLVSRILPLMCVALL